MFFISMGFAKLESSRLRGQGHPQAPLLTGGVYPSEFVSVSILLLFGCHVTSSVHCLAVSFVSYVLFGYFGLKIQSCQ